MNDDDLNVIDLCHVPRDQLCGLYSQVKQLNEDLAITDLDSAGRLFFTYLDSIKELPLSFGSPLHGIIYGAFCEHKSVRHVAQLHNLSVHQTLDLLLEKVFHNGGESLIDFVPIMTEFCVSTDCVCLVREYLANTADVTLRAMLHDLLLPPSVLKISLAILYSNVPIRSLANANANMLAPQEASQMTEVQLLQHFDSTYQDCLRSTADRRCANHHNMWADLVQEGANVSQLFDDVDAQLKELTDRLQDYQRDQEKKRVKQEAFGRQVSENFEMPVFAPTFSRSVNIATATATPTASVVRHVADDDIMIVDDDHNCKASTHKIPSSTLSNHVAQLTPIVGQFCSNRSKNIGVTLISSDRAVEMPPLALRAPTVLPELHVDDLCYIKKKDRHWYEATVKEVIVRNGEPHFVVRIEQGKHFNVKELNGRNVAFAEWPTWILPVGSRVIAYYHDGSSQGYFAGMVAECPTVRNNGRYLVFFDDGYTQYCPYKQIFRVSWASDPVWLDMEPQTQAFIQDYLSKYPEKAMVRLVKGATVQAEYEGHFSTTRILEVDASLAKLLFSNGRVEWIYRGSTRLGPLFYKQIRSQGAREKGAGQRMQSSALRRGTEPVVEYTQLVDRTKPKPTGDHTRAEANNNRKSSLMWEPEPAEPTIPENLAFKVVLRERQVPEWQIPKGRPHTCSRRCLGERDRNAERDFKYENPLMIPLLSGWQRRLSQRIGVLKRRTEVAYVTPCGRRLCNAEMLSKFLHMTDSCLMIDWFCFDHHVKVTRTAETAPAIYKNDDITRGKETVKIPVINVLNSNSPPLMEYVPNRIPGEKVNLNNDGNFVSCCDCTDNCLDRSKCACQQLTFRAARMYNHGRDYPKAGYHYRRLKLSNMDHTIYECNARCKCDKRCVNRVVQRPLQRRMQVFFTGDKGWGVRTLDDIPKGAFICTYAGEILTDANADRHGKDFGDEYFADLNHIEFMEMSLDDVKEGYEAVTVPPVEPLGELLHGGQNAIFNDDDDEDVDDKTGSDSDSDDGSSSEPKGSDSQDHDELSSRQDVVDAVESSQSRLQSSFMGPKQSISAAAMTGHDGADASGVKNAQGISLRTYYGENWCYIINLKHSGNVGRYLNHSCQPNCRVHNVLIDTHDLRFPHIAFFSTQRIGAGTELCWDYSYEVDSVPGKTITCGCRTEQCRGRLL